MRVVRMKTGDKGIRRACASALVFVRTSGCVKSCMRVSGSKWAGLTCAQQVAQTRRDKTTWKRLALRPQRRLKERKRYKLALLSIEPAKPPRQTPPQKRARYHFTICWPEKRAYAIHRNFLPALLQPVELPIEISSNWLLTRADREREKKKKKVQFVYLSTSEPPNWSVCLFNRMACKRGG